MSGLYDDTLARIHCSAYSDRVAQGHGWIIDTIRAAHAKPTVHDLGCGDGRFVQAARDAGIAAGGSDISPAFVALATARGLDVVQAPARTAPWTAGTTALTGLGEALAYLDGDGPSLWPVAEAAVRTLPRGGLLIADLIGPNVPEGCHENVRDGWRIRSQTATRDGVLTRSIGIDADGRQTETVHRQAILDPDTVMAQLSALGFDVAIRDGYGFAPLLPGRFAVVARLA